MARENYLRVFFVGTGALFAALASTVAFASDHFYPVPDERHSIELMEFDLLKVVPVEECLELDSADPPVFLAARVETIDQNYAQREAVNMLYLGQPPPLIVS